MNTTTDTPPRDLWAEVLLAMPAETDEAALQSYIEELSESNGMEESETCRIALERLDEFKQAFNEYIDPPVKMADKVTLDRLQSLCDQTGSKCSDIIKKYTVNGKGYKKDLPQEGAEKLIAELENILQEQSQSSGVSERQQIESDIKAVATRLNVNPIAELEDRYQCNVDELDNGTLQKYLKTLIEREEMSGADQGPPQSDSQSQEKNLDVFNWSDGLLLRALQSALGKSGLKDETVIYHLKRYYGANGMELAEEIQADLGPRLDQPDSFIKWLKNEVLP